MVSIICKFFMSELLAMVCCGKEAETAAHFEKNAIQNIAKSKQRRKCMSGIVVVLWIVFSIGVWIAYHKIFAVYYFNLSQGLMKELILSAFLGAILTALTLYFWWITTIILLLVGLGVSGKTENPSGKKAIIVIFVIAAIVVAIVGISYRSQVSTDAATSARGYRVEKAVGQEV